MAVPIEQILALVFRFAMAFVYLYLFLYFYKSYKKSKEQGLTNNYFYGFSILFAILVVFHVLYGSYEYYINILQGPVDLKQQFPWFDENTNDVGSLSHQIRPAYLIFYFLMNMVIATQVYPLEQALGWKKTPASKIIILCGCSLWLLFIPALSYSLAAWVIVIAGFLGIAIGFMLNIGANLKLFRNSVGALRKRALYAVFAFLLLALGLIWSMEVGWGELIYQGIGNREDVVIGCLIQIVAVVFYKLGFMKKEE